MNAQAYLESEIQRYLDEAQKLTAKGRLDAADKKQVDQYLKTVEELKEKIRSFEVRRAWVDGDVSKLSAEEIGRMVKDRASFAEMESHYAVNQKNGPGRNFADTLFRNGWSLKNMPSVTVNLAEALGVKAVALPDAEEWNRLNVPDVAPFAYDTRHLFRNLPVQDAGEASAVADFRVIQSEVESGPNPVERALDAVTEKAKMAVEIEHFAEELKQYAVLIPSIPNQVLESMQQAFQVFNTAGQQQVETAVDQAVYNEVTAAAGSAGEGETLVAQIRSAIGSQRDLGYNPDLLVVNSATGALLDLFETEGGGLEFASRSTGSASPIWGCRIVETGVAADAPPVLIDTRKIGSVYLGRMRFDADPFSEFNKNLTTIRVEINALPVVRDAGAAVFVTDESS